MDVLNEMPVDKDLTSQGSRRASKGFEDSVPYLKTVSSLRTSLHSPDQQCRIDADML